MEKQIEQLIKYANEAWAELDHNEHELLVSRLYMSIEAVKAAQQGVQADKCQTCGAIGMFDQDECSVCGTCR